MAGSTGFRQPYICGPLYMIVVALWVKSLHALVGGGFILKFCTSTPETIPMKMNSHPSREQPVSHPETLIASV
jgi:hypothetical protein